MWLHGVALYRLRIILFYDRIISKTLTLALPRIATITSYFYGKI
jgi:hypothetical protein